jgi:pimeloyl-ACP methyl ester carboxylesterase
MSDSVTAGPYKLVPLGNGKSAPLYLIDFDKEGRSEGPLTRKHLLDTVSGGDFTDIYVLSHGWNNVFKDAVGLYERLLTGYLAERQALGLNNPGYRPLYVGIIWPSTALVLPWEEGPDFAAAGAVDPIAKSEQVRSERREIAQRLEDSDITRFYELAEKNSLSREEALELARILAPIWADADGEIPSTGAAPTPEEMVELWRSVATRGGGQGAPKEHGLADDDEEEPGPGAASWLDFLDPRRPIQLATVLLMKDRSGTVGSKGVTPLLTELLAASTARVHLVGHSYGCRVVLSALSYPTILPRKVDSVLLLQPATSYLCFAADAGAGKPGGYRPALDRTEKPIFSTFSSHDAPLTKFFHLAARRKSDLGDQQIAALPPSKFAALGGFGPGGLGTAVEQVRMAPNPFKYPTPDPGVRVFALLGTDGINGHGDVTNRYTWWALLNQVSGDQLP